MRSHSHLDFLPFRDVLHVPCSLLSLRILVKYFLKCSYFLMVTFFSCKQLCFVRVCGSCLLTCRKFSNVRSAALSGHRRDPVRSSHRRKSPVSPCSECSLPLLKYSQRPSGVSSSLLLGQEFLVESGKWPKNQGQMRMRRVMRKAEE